MDECKGLSGALFGHKYEAVYDTTRTFPDHMAGVKIATLDGAEVIMSKTSTYVGSFCKRCGKTINV